MKRELAEINKKKKKDDRYLQKVIETSGRTKNYLKISKEMDEYYQLGQTDQ